MVEVLVCFMVRMVFLKAVLVVEKIDFSDARSMSSTPHLRPKEAAGGPLFKRISLSYLNQVPFGK